MFLLRGKSLPRGLCLAIQSRHQLARRLQAYAACVQHHLQRDAHGQDDAACQQVDYLADISHRIQVLDDGHAEVDAEAEEEGDDYLREIHPEVVLHLPARHEGQLQQYKKQVEHDGPLPHGERGEHAGDVGDAGDGRGAQCGLGDVSDSHRVDKEGDGEECVTPEKIFVLHTWRFNQSALSSKRVQR